MTVADALEQKIVLVAVKERRKCESHFLTLSRPEAETISVPTGLSK